MAAECVLNKFFLKPKKLHNPEDKIKYIIPLKIIQNTEKVLTAYGTIEPPNEGLVYWGGIEEDNEVTIKLVVAPRTDSNSARITTSHRSNFDFVRLLNRYNVVQIAQVHSHPSDWVDHSYGDDQLAAFKSEGLLSLVVPEYCSKGMIPLTICGIHRYSNDQFVRLSETYIDNHFVIKKRLDAYFEDLRK